MNFKDLVKKLNNDGWVQVSVKGSHYHFKHPKKSGKVTVPLHSNKDIAYKTLETIFKQAGLK